MYKLGPHVTRSTPGGIAWARRAAIVKSIDDVGPLTVAPDNAIRIYRKVFAYQDQESSKSGASIARQIIVALGGYNHPRLYVEVFNEWRQQRSEIEWHADLVQETTKTLHAAGYKVAGFSFSTGNPEMDVWIYLQGRNFCGVDALSIHEYWAAKDFSTWNALRYRRVHDWLGGQHPPFVVTECGRDAIRDEGGEGKPGWKLQGISADEYAAELRNYAAELERDNYMLGGVVYTFGPWDDFAAFDAEGIVALMPAASGPITIPIPPTGGGAMATYHLGNTDIADLRATLPRGVGVYGTRQISAIKRLVIHHSATPATTTAEQMARYHIGTHGWPGIGYHFVVTTSGEIQYTADHTMVTNGVSYENADTVHVCLVGDFTSAPPPAAQLAATKRLIDNYCLAMGQRYPVVGHRDIAHADDPTACPGDTWTQWRAALIDAPTDYQAELLAARKTIAAQNNELASLRGKIAAAKTALS
jgi:hypothetical protein